MGKFDLSALLAEGKVPDLGTKPDARKQIEYIHDSLIDDDPQNFYELPGIEELAANIELFGIQQPLLVRTNPEDSSRVIIISGHRRRRANRMLIDAGRKEREYLPCIREGGIGSAALEELRLIYANSDTRKKTSAEIAKEAERVEQLLYQLKEEGYEFPGRMRDHVAEACKVSKSKLARLKVIRDNLTKKLKKTWEKGKLNESVAYAFAQKPVDVQDKALFYLSNRSYGTNPEHWRTGTVEDAIGCAEKLMTLKCKKCGGTCENSDAMLLRLTAGGCWDAACRQGKCCDACSDLVNCKKACPHLSEKVKQLRADRKAQRAHDAEVKAERDRPTVGRITTYWKRFGEARRIAGISVKSWFKAMEMNYGNGDNGKTDKEYEQKETGQKIKRDTTLPYGYNFHYRDADRLCRAADTLNCSIDYLLCRTDDPKGPAAQVPADGWIPLQWHPGKDLPQKDRQPAVCLFKLEGLEWPKQLITQWDATLQQWRFPQNGATIDAECVGWFPLPEEEC